MKTFSRDRIDPGWITPSTLMNEEGVKQSFVPVFKKSGWLDGGKGGKERKREREEAETDREIETAALLHVDILSLRQFRRNEYHGRIYVNDKLKRGEKEEEIKGSPPPPLPTSLPFLYETRRENND